MKSNKHNSIHIGIYGRRNVGKSSLINSLTGQDTAIVSEVAGTTTDPVKKSIEIFGIGPVIIIDTAGIDDIDELGQKRIDKTLKSIEEIDIAILVFSENNFDKFENDLIAQFKKLKIPYLIIANKSDLIKIEDSLKNLIRNKFSQDIIEFSCFYKNKIEIITDRLIEVYKSLDVKKASLLGDLIKYGDIVLLITPIDNEAPEGRLILPQVQAIRDILDNDCTAIVMKEKEVDIFLKRTGLRPDLVITDSQIFNKADAMIPKDIPLTSFSIVLAHHKGDFEAYLEGTPKLSELKDGDRVLLLESCTHQVSCDDIGRVKIPRWINSFTGKQIEFDFVHGLDRLSRPIEDYSLVIQCGGCVVTKKQLMNRLQKAKDKDIVITNYGMAIAYLQGIYERAIKPFRKNIDLSENYL